MAQSPLSLDSFTSFGELLKHLRKRAGLTQRELAQAVNYTDSQITRLESNSRSPDPAVVRALFIDALHLQHEHEAARRLIHLAELARGKENSQDESDLAEATERNNNLPASLTDFIGRERELAEVLRLMKRTRLLTLTGTGGCGKTRLAIEAASRVQADYPDGIWLVELASLTFEALVANTVTAALGLHVAVQPAIDTLIDHLRSRHMLLVIDNCEHVIAACAELAEALLRACPKLHMLTTSREALNVPGEIAWRMPSMATNEAVQLFETRAMSAIPESALTVKDTGTIAKICERLDGIPLAIELAAARLRVYSLDMIASRLDNRFKLLTGGSRTALPRHQTLHALIDWSYNLLSADEQKLLRYLSVFAGGWTLEGIEATFTDMSAADVLSQLVDKSLVIVTESVIQKRYTMLETIRQFASERSYEQGETKNAYERVGLYLERTYASLTRKGTDEASLRMAEINNLRPLVKWTKDQGDAIAYLNVVATLVLDFTWDYFDNAVEVLTWMNEALEYGKDAPDELRLIVFARQLGLRSFIGYHLKRWVEQAEEYLSLAERIGKIDLAYGRSELLFWCSMAHWHAQNYDRVFDLCKFAVELGKRYPKDDSTRIFEYMLGMVHLKKDEYEPAANYFQQCIVSGLEDDNGDSVLLGINGLTWMDATSALLESQTVIAQLRIGYKEETYFRSLQAYTQPLIVHHDFVLAEQSLNECIDFWRRIGVIWANSCGSAQALLDLGQIAWLQNDPLTALNWFEQSLQEYNQVGDQERIARSHIYLGLTHLVLGKPDHAAQFCRTGLNVYRELAQPAGIALALSTIARLAEARDEMTLAAKLFGFAALPQDFLALSILWPASPVIYQHEIAQARERFAGTPWMQHWHEGEIMTQEEAIALALKGA